MSYSAAGFALDQLSQAAIDLLPVAIFVTAVPGGEIVRVNQRALDLSGGHGFVSGRLQDYLRTAGGRVRAGMPDSISIALSAAQSVSGLDAVVQVSDTQVPVSVSIEPIREPGGQVTAAVTTCHRIPGSMDAAAALQRSEQRLALAVAAGRLGIWEFDLGTGTLACSAQCKANHGLPPDGDLQLEAHLLPAIDPEFRDAFRSALDTAIATHSSFAIEVPHRWPDGTRHWLFAAGNVIDPTCMVGVSLDITARRQIEQALRESEERFRALADNMSQLAWMADDGGSIFWYNRRWLEYTGETLDEMRGWGWQKVHHPDHVDAVVEKIRRCFETGQTWEDTFPLRGADGTYRWFLSRAVPIRDEHGRIVRWFGTNTDITEQRRTEEALIAADRSKDEFLAVLCHELRNPIAPIAIAVKLLELKGPPDAALQKLRDTILRQTLQLSKLVEDLLDVGRIINGKLRLDRTPTDLRPIVMQGIETCSPLVERRRHTLKVLVRDTPVVVDIDSARMVQVV
jgi:PAS domain S-box-containing protein